MIVTRRIPAQALVEFALIITMFTTVVLGIFDWARASATYISMANATREATRQAQVITNATTHQVYADCSVGSPTLPCSDMQAVVNAALSSYTLQLGPGYFATPGDVCLFDPGTVLDANTIATCTATSNNGPEAPSKDAVLVVRATYTVNFVPLMSVILPNGLTFSTSTVAYLE